jgi:hypothetical protein
MMVGNNLSIFGWEFLYFLLIVWGLGSKSHLKKFVMVNSGAEWLLFMELT